ncbi:serine/threonine-protein kinase [Cryptosporangium phraense]|uniref:Serine/threonine protein kinase n=1 Tax=Cryptosporangium phraense TaxID=2593070 RepID=A0A545AMA7_9ACTN|nr:serine/threonine-protein kinase [Cryptosporangium phraense]TQS42401.1 serine/threonine protein kinase [Cryptosporangium phraense]
MTQQGDSTPLLDEARSLRTALDEVAARRREVLDRYDVLSLALMLIGVSVFASVAAFSFSSGQTGRGQAFLVLTLLAVPFVLFAAWTSVGRFLVLSRRAARMEQRLVTLPSPVEEAVTTIEAALPAYVVRRGLGQGGCGVVYLAEHRRAGWSRAVKLLTETALPDSQERFLREAQVMESLDHPHIARVYEYVENCIVMEYLPGGTAVARAGQGPGVVCAIGLGVASALAAAHQRNVVHRDIKPGNLLFADDGTVKVTDFGIAKLLAAGATGEPASVLALTPGYAAPEQLNADDITARTDLYGLAATLYRLLTGSTPPLPGPDGAPRADLAGIPPRIAAVLARSLDAYPERRHADAQAFALDLARAAARDMHPGWLDASGVPFRGDPEIRAAASR